jgi:hypothetical protein
MPATRQLCKASNTVTPPTRGPLACPVCGRKVTVTQVVKQTSEGITERWPVVPSHAADPQGEVRVLTARNKTRAPGSGWES